MDFAVGYELVSLIFALCARINLIVWRLVQMNYRKGEVLLQGVLSREYDERSNCLKDNKS